MITVDSKGGGIACLVIALVLLGTWAPGLNYCERKGRHPAHTYMDFSIGFLAVAVVCALTLGQLGNSGSVANINFFDQLKQDNGPCVGYALAAGAFVQFGNFGVQWGCALCGVCVTMAANGSLIVIIGTTLNYFLDDRLNNAALLFPGVGCFVIAVCCGVATHVSEQKQANRHLDDNTQSSMGSFNPNGEVLHDPMNDSAHGQQGSTPAALKAPAADAKVPVARGQLPPPAGKLQEEPDSEKQLTRQERRALKRQAHADNLQTERAVKVSRSERILLGSVIIILAGVSAAFFSPAFNLASNDQWHTLPEGVPPLTTYTGYFYFCLMYIFLAFLETQLFLYRPPLGLPKSSWTAYLKDNDYLRIVGFVAGVLVSIANVLQFIGGQVAGYAASDLVQANPLVATLWGILFFREFWGANRLVSLMLASMLLFYVLAVGLLIGSVGNVRTV